MASRFGRYGVPAAFAKTVSVRMTWIRPAVRLAARNRVVRVFGGCTFAKLRSRRVQRSSGLGFDCHEVKICLILRLMGRVLKQIRHGVGFFNEKIPTWPFSGTVG